MPSVQFKSLFNKSVTLALKVSDFSRIHVDFLKWSDYVSYFKENYDLKIKVDKDYFPYQIKDVLSGKTVYKNGKTRIGINPYMPVNRQHFTTSHELSHFILHINNGSSKSQNFNSLISDTFNGRTLEEQEADTLASYIMINPYAFMRAFAMQSTWQEIMEMFGISSSALYHRVMYYLVEQKGWNFYEAKQILSNYEHGDGIELSSMLYADICTLIDTAGQNEFNLISESTFEIVN